MQIEEQNMTGEAVEWSAPVFTSMIWPLSPSSGGKVDSTISQDINVHVSWQEVSLYASNDSSSIMMASFQSLFLYLHYEGSMDKCRERSQVCWTGTIC